MKAQGSQGASPIANICHQFFLTTEATVAITEATEVFVPFVRNMVCSVVKIDFTTPRREKNGQKANSQ